MHAVIELPSIVFPPGKNPLLEQKMTAFLQSVRVARVVHDYPKELIGNMDETPMYFDMSGNTTIDKKGTKTISVRTTGAEKRHLTVVLAATADGQKGWMDDDLMKKWIRQIWVKYTQRKKLFW